MAKMLMVQLQSAPYIGTAYLNAAAKSAKHRFKLHLGTDIPGIISTIKSEKPDLIGFSCMSVFHKDTLAICRQIRKHCKQPIILGGPHPTLFPDVIKEQCIDIICRGEGEFALIELLDAMQSNRDYSGIKNLWVKKNNTIYKNPLRNLAEPMDILPVIDWSCYEGTPVKNSPPVAFPIRGCPYSCTYCFNHTMQEMYRGLGPYVRHFSVKRAIQEIKESIKFFSHSPVVFQSDSFGIDLEWTEQLFSKYSKVTDLPFAVLVRPELATEKCIAILAKYKCLNVAIGVESGSERIRREIMHRNYSNSLLLEVADRLHRHGIKFRTYNMIGLPTETISEMWETINLNIHMKTDFPRATIFTPMPDTRIVEIAKKSGDLDTDFSFESIPGSVYAGTILKKLDNDKVMNMLYFFQTYIAYPSSRWLIRRLMKLKPNIIFRYWFYLIYAHLHRKSEKRAVIAYIKYLISNRKYI